MLYICLFGFLMIFKGLEIRIHIYRSSQDAFLSAYKKQFIIYNDKHFMLFMSLYYAIMGFVIVILSIFHEFQNNVVLTLLSFALYIILNQIVLNRIGKKFYKKRFS